MLQQKRKKKRYLGSLLFLIVILLPLLFPQTTVIRLEDALQRPNLIHWLGTDANGRDILILMVSGARISLGISILVVSLCVFFGLVAGFLAGFYGGIVDRLFLVVSDVFQAFPGILLAIGIAAFLPQSILNLILLLSFVGWVSYARVIRSQVIEIKSREFITAARAIGVSNRRQLFTHFLPNMMSPLIVQASFGLAGVILAESTLSFLGLGLPENIPSLGKLMDQGVGLLLVAPHVALFPGLLIMCFVLGFNLLGDRMRKAIAS